MNKNTMNNIDENGRTPLHHAAWECNYEAVKTAISNGADINAKDACGATPLQDTCNSTLVKPARRRHGIMIARLLVVNGAHINDIKKDHPDIYTMLKPIEEWVRLHRKNRALKNPEYAAQGL